ncbi:hypothetical protein [Streptomyces sp. YS415]|uniref:hypothetical protein n=1 Tax=Streptomyces sp. YS415 TaxID=2944806 RepID=UPI0020212458|nr:hypothetical protein [Streptomyces sp. YS415]MCL7425124.1 hypothetical protein [Streptomyces sp. YS415]
MRAGRTGSATALAGALALVAFTAPAAEAADTGISVSNLVINNGKPIVVGTTAEVTPDFTFRVTRPAAYEYNEIEASPFLYHGVTAAQGAQDGGIYSGSETYYEDGYVEGELYIDPPYRLDSNNDATTWKIAVSARTWGSDGQPDAEEYLTGFGTVQVKRMARATVNASPEPVAKGKALTVTGKLTRADWVKHAYVGYGGKSAKLQFRKAGTSTYNTVKIVQAGSTGSLKTTVTAAADGYWRWTFSETSTTGGATAAGDYVDVT